MGWKTILILVLTFFLLLNGLTKGALLNFILPHKEEIVARTLCLVGGFIANPFFQVGSLKIPYPSSDDAIFATVMVGVFTYLVLRHAIKDIKKLLILVFIFWWIFFSLSSFDDF